MMLPLPLDSGNNLLATRVPAPGSPLGRALAEIASRHSQYDADAARQPNAGVQLGGGGRRDEQEQTRRQRRDARQYAEEAEPV